MECTSYSCGSNNVGKDEEKIDTFPIEIMKGIHEFQLNNAFLDVKYHVILQI